MGVFAREKRKFIARTIRTLVDRSESRIRLSQSIKAVKVSVVVNILRYSTYVRFAVEGLHTFDHMQKNYKYGKMGDRM